MILPFVARAHFEILRDSSDKRNVENWTKVDSKAKEKKHQQKLTFVFESIQKETHLFSFTNAISEVKMKSSSEEKEKTWISFRRVDE